MNPEIEKLFKKYQEGRLTRAELEEVRHYLNAEEYHEEWRDVLKADADVMMQSTAELEMSGDEVQQLYARILNTANVNTCIPKPPIVKKLWFKITTAAAVVTVLLSTIVILNSVQDPAKERAVKSKYANDVPAGTNTATLTFATGKRIQLSSAKTGVVIDATKLTYNDGSEIKNPVTSQLTLTTPRGGQYQVKLPDGTLVCLNSASTLKFPSVFAGLKERKVILTGEAWFSVKHHNKQPFRVQTATQVVEDIGTEFNINAYVDEVSTITTLIEGSASVNGVTLTQNQEANLQNGKIKVSTVEPSDAIAWKNGYFMFNNEPLSVVMRKISRWYNVTIKFNDPLLAQKEVYGTVTRFTSVSKVLEMLEQTGVVAFEIKDRQMIINQPTKPKK